MFTLLWLRLLVGSFLGNLCEVTLLLRLGKSSEASSRVKDMKDSLLEDYLINHTHFIVNMDEDTFTSLGKVWII